MSSLNRNEAEGVVSLLGGSYSGGTISSANHPDRSERKFALRNGATDLEDCAAFPPLSLGL